MPLTEDGDNGDTGVPPALVLNQRDTAVKTRVFQGSGTCFITVNAKFERGAWTQDNPIFEGRAVELIPGGNISFYRVVGGQLRTILAIDSSGNILTNGSIRPLP